MTTATSTNDLRNTLDKANPSTLPNAANKVKLGTMLSVVKIVVAGLTAASAVDITTAAVKAAATITGITLEDGELLPAIADVVSLRISASGTAASLGVYGIGDDGATAIVPPGGAGLAMGIAKLSDDGKTLTFPNTVTGFVLVYRPRSAVPLTDLFPLQGIG